MGQSGGFELTLEKPKDKESGAHWRANM